MCDNIKDEDELVFEKALSETERKWAHYAYHARLTRKPVAFESCGFCNLDLTFRTEYIYPLCNICIKSELWYFDESDSQRNVCGNYFRYMTDGLDIVNNKLDKQLVKEVRARLRYIRRHKNEFYPLFKQALEESRKLPRKETTNE